MLSGNTPVQDFRVGGGTTAHGQRGNVPRAAKKADPLPVLRSRSYRKVYDDTQTLYAWYGAIN